MPRRVTHADRGRASVIALPAKGRTGQCRRGDAGFKPKDVRTAIATGHCVAELTLLNLGLPDVAKLEWEVETGGAQSVFYSQLASSLGGEPRAYLCLCRKTKTDQLRHASKDFH
jgi:hypothetical protein